MGHEVKIQCHSRMLEMGEPEPQALNPDVGQILLGIQGQASINWGPPPLNFLLFFLSPHP